MTDELRALSESVGGGDNRIGGELDLVPFSVSSSSVAAFGSLCGKSLWTLLDEWKAAVRRSRTSQIIERAVLSSLSHALDKYLSHEPT